MFKNLLNIASNERRTVTRGGQDTATSEEQKVVKVKFAHDIQALKDAGYSIANGECIELSLTAALELMPRDRRRVDAYKTLANYLQAAYGVSLIIVSRKNKKNNENDGI